VLFGLSSGLVPGGFGGLDAGLRLRPGLLDRLPRLPLHVRGPGLSGAHRGGGVLGPADRLASVGAG